MQCLTKKHALFVSTIRKPILIYALRLLFATKMLVIFIANFSIRSIFIKKKA